MADTQDTPQPEDDVTPPREELPPAARRALAEADARRKAAARERPLVEKGGPAGPEPTRYGDWERKGRAVDF